MPRAGPASASRWSSVGVAFLGVHETGGSSAGLFEDLSETRAIGDALLVNLCDAVTFALVDTIEKRPTVFDLDVQHAFRGEAEAAPVRRPAVGSEGWPRIPSRLWTGIS